MAELIAIASGKGGVGKSFLSSSLALSLNEAGRKTLLVDADLGGANLHNFLGYKVPPVGLYNFLREKIRLDDIITQTPVGVDFIAGSGDVLGMAHITKVERSRFIDKIKNSDYEFVILDLGAGTSFNMVDLFNQAERRILAMNSEPTSLENAYGFLKIAIYRHIERFLSSNPIFDDVNRKLRNKSATYQNVTDIANDVEAIDTENAGQIRNFIKTYKLGIVLNMVRFKKELNVFYGFESIVKKYLHIKVEKLGHIPYDEGVCESVRVMRPFYQNHRDSDTAECVDYIRKLLLEKL